MEKKQTKPDWFMMEEIEIVYKRKIKTSERPLIKSSADIADILRQVWNQDKIDLQEEFKVMFMNRSNRIIGVMEVSTGGITGTVADPRLILGAAVKACAVSMILAHNHPSGSLKPSRADTELTSKIREAARYFDMDVLDHIIITSEGYLSFADEGLL